MSNEKEDLDTKFASQVAEVVNCKLPAIKVIKRAGSKEVEFEFATFEDYKSYMLFEEEAEMDDKQKYDAVLRSDRISSEDTIKRLYDIVERLSKSGLI